MSGLSIQCVNGPCESALIGRMNLEFALSCPQWG